MFERDGLKPPTSEGCQVQVEAEAATEATPTEARVPRWWLWIRSEVSMDKMDKIDVLRIQSPSEHSHYHDESVIGPPNHHVTMVLDP